MKRRIAVLSSLFILCSSPLMAAEDSSMKGVWSRGDGAAKVRIDNCGGALCAVNLWIKPGTPSEKVGDKLIMRLASSGNGKFSGEAEDPQRGLTYNLQVNVDGPSMTTRGCVLAKIICKSVSWTRSQ
jgi:uncharacterized protein (DUF2147 family)